MCQETCDGLWNKQKKLPGVLSPVHPFGCLSYFTTLKLLKTGNYINFVHKIANELYSVGLIIAAIC